jgi:hypothetical protein
VAAIGHRQLEAPVGRSQCDRQHALPRRAVAHRIPAQQRQELGHQVGALEAHAVQRVGIELDAVGCGGFQRAPEGPVLGHRRRLRGVHAGQDDDAPRVGHAARSPGGRLQNQGEDRSAASERKLHDSRQLDDSARCCASMAP